MREFLAFLILLVLTFWGKNVFAEDKAKKYQAHFRTGFLGASYSGADNVDGSFNVPTAVDIEFEFFKTNRQSFTLRTTMAMDFSSSQVRYTYGGVGQRFYFWSQGNQVINFDGGNSLISIPKLRFYGGWGVGIAQVLVLEFGPVLGTYGTIIDGGGNIGTIYQVSQDFGLSAHLEMNYGLGFSSVTVSGLSYRLFLGGTYFF